MTTFNSLVGNECPTEVAKLINAIISGKCNIDLDNLSQTGQAILDGKASISLDNLSNAGQAILDAKLEAQCLLNQNGYIKFSNNLTIQWGYVDSAATSTNYTIDFPVSFSTGTIPAVVFSVLYNTNMQSGYNQIIVGGITNTGFTCRYGISRCWIAIGY